MDLFTELLFEFASVRNQTHADRPVHQRFPAEEIDFQMLSGSAVLHQKVERALADVQRHEHARPVEISRSGKAVFASEIAVVRNMQAHGLDRAAAGNLRRLRLVRFKRAGIAELFQIGKHFADGFARHANGVRVFPALQRGRN